MDSQVTLCNGTLYSVFSNGTWPLPLDKASHSSHIRLSTSWYATVRRFMRGRDRILEVHTDQPVDKSTIRSEKLINFGCGIIKSNAMAILSGSSLKNNDYTPYISLFLTNKSGYE